MKGHPETRFPAPSEAEVGAEHASRVAGSAPGPDAVRSALAGVRVVLVEPSHPGNVGAVARAMKTMGLTRLYIVRPRHFPSAEATARAAGADDLLVSAKVCGELSEALGDCAWAAATSVRVRHLPWPELDPAACAREVLARSREEVALVFGRESTGLTNPEIDLCQAVVRIPTDDSFPSLNLGGSVQLLAWELRRALLAGAATGNAPVPATPASDRDPLARLSDLDGFHAHLERTLVDIGYLDPGAPRQLMRRLRRFFNRAGMLRSELNILRGVLRAAQHCARAARHRPDEPGGPGG